MPFTGNIFHIPWSSREERFLRGCSCREHFVRCCASQGHTFERKLCVCVCVRVCACVCVCVCVCLCVCVSTCVCVAEYANPSICLVRALSLCVEEGIRTAWRLSPDHLFLPVCMTVAVHGPGSYLIESTATLHHAPRAMYIR